MKLKGYIFSRDFFGERVPQNVQNIVLRDYCKKNKHTFLLSGTEYTFKKSSYILFEILEKLNNYDGILFYSLYQLPEDKEKRKEFFKKIIHKKKQIHFTLENIILKNMKDVDYVEKIFLLIGRLSVNQLSMPSSPHCEKTENSTSFKSFILLIFF